MGPESEIATLEAVAPQNTPACRPNANLWVGTARRAVLSVPSACSANRPYPASLPRYPARYRFKSLALQHISSLRPNVPYLGGDAPNPSIRPAAPLPPVQGGIVNVPRGTSPLEQKSPALASTTSDHKTVAPFGPSSRRAQGPAAFPLAPSPYIIYCFSSFLLLYYSSSAAAPLKLPPRSVTLPLGDDESICGLLMLSD